MGNCLKTQLKEVVQNSNLLKLGEIHITLEPNAVFANGLWQAEGGQSVIDLVSGEATISTSSGASFPYNVPTTVGNKITITAGENGAVLSITDKYNLICADGLFFNKSFAWKEINYFQSLEYLVWEKGLNTGQIYISGDLNDLAEGNNLDTVFVDSVVGDISNFGKSRKLNVLTLYFGSGLYGSLESLVAKARVYRSEYSGGIILRGFDRSAVTFNGELITNEEGFSNPKFLSWTASTITFDGVTINA